MTETASKLEILRSRAEGTNVNSVTLLATDYLNHFNEALMLAELVIDMPDMFCEFEAWKPKSYKTHFLESGIADRQLAIDAYEYSPEKYKVGFEATVEKLNSEIHALQEHISASENDEEIITASRIITDKCLMLRQLIDEAGGIINGRPVQNPGSPDYTGKATDDVTLDQGDIDALFD